MLTDLNKILQTDNIFLIAAISTILVPIILIVIGFIINLISDVLTSFIAIILGSSAAYLIRNYVTYIGTVHHEFAHAAFAAVTGAKVTKITLHPKGNTLGSVTFIPRGNFLTKSFQMSLTAVAPVICGLLTMSLLQKYVYVSLTAIWQYVLYAWIFISILFHTNMSSVDIRNGAKGLPLCMLVLYVVFLVTGINLYNIIGNGLSGLATTF